MSSFTDHYPLFVSLSIEKCNEKQNLNNTYYVDYNRINIECKRVNWDQFNNLKDPEQAIDLLIANIKKIVPLSTKSKK